MDQFTVFEYKRPRITRVGKIMIQPGVNRIKTDLARRLKHDRRWQHLLDTGQIVIKTGKVPASETIPDAGPEIPETLEGKSVKGAAEIVAQVYDRETLQRWAEEDDRKGVQAAIEKQLKKLDEESASESGAGEDDESEPGDDDSEVNSNPEG